MSESRKTNVKQLTEDNQRLRALVAQLEDRLDHLAEHGTAAKAIKEHESLHRDVMSLVSDAVLVADDAGRVSYVSPNAHFIFGHSAADILKQGHIGFVLPRNLFDLDILERRGEIDNIECQVRDALGRARDLLVTVRRIDAHGGTVMYAVRDVTERLKLKLDNELLSHSLERRVDERTRELRESRDQFRRMVEGLRDEYFFYATDPDGIVRYISPSVYSILGYSPQSLIGKNWRQHVAMDHELYPELERLEEMRFSGGTTPPFRAPVIDAAGRIRILQVRDAAVRDAEGRVIASEGICKDITDRLEEDEELRRARDELQKHVYDRTAELEAINKQLHETTQRYQSVVDDQLEFIIRWRQSGKRNFENEAYRRHLNNTQRGSSENNFLSSIIEIDRERLAQKLAALTVEDPVVTHEHRVALSDGRIVLEAWTHRALFDPDGNLSEYQSVGSDITDKRRREMQAQELNMALAQHNALTDRERDVMDLVVAGDANKVIARKLGLSVKTIEKHRSGLMKKLGVRSVPELVRVAMLIDESASSLVTNE
jgi:PAS domain S-box-containing protein